MTSSKDLALGFLVILAWAANTIATKFITFEVDPFTGLSLRLAIAVLVCIPLIRWPGREKFWLMFQISMLLVVMHWSSLIWGIDKLDASMASILLQTQVIFSVLLGRFLFNEKFGWRTGVGIALGIAGVAVLVGLPEHPPSMAGVLVMIFSMLSIALSYARMKTLTGVSPLNYIAHMHILAFIPVLALTFIFEKPFEADWSAINYPVLIIGLLFQVFIVSGSHMLWQRLMSRNTMSGLPNLTLLLPILGVIMAMIALGEKLTPTMLLGGIITMTGVAIIMVRRHKKLQA